MRGLCLHALSFKSIVRLKKIREGAIAVCGIAFLLKVRTCASKQFLDGCTMTSPGHAVASGTVQI